MTKGVFWDARTPVRHIPAKLKLRHGAPSLHFTVPHDDLTGHLGLGYIDVVHGLTSTGEQVTLLHTSPTDNFVLNEQTSKPGHSAYKQSFDYVFFGAHIDEPDTAVFRQSTVQFRFLSEWVRYPGTMPAEQKEPPVFDTAVIPNVYESGADVTVTIENAAVVELFPDGTKRFSRFQGKDARIVFTFDTPQTVQTHTRLAFDLRALLTFSLQQTAVITEQTIACEAGSPELTYSYQRDTRKKQIPVHHSRLVITPASLSPAILFPRWWDATRDLYPVPQILAGRYYTKQAYIEGHVLAAVASTEKLYTLLKLPKTRFDKEFFKLRKDELVQREKDRGDDSEQQADFVTVLNEALQNTPTFDMKLRALAAHAGHKMFAAADIDVELWVTKVRRVRNKLAHEGSHVAGANGDEDDWLKRVDYSTRVVLSLLVRDWLGAPPLDPRYVRARFPGRGVQHEPEPKAPPAADADE